MKKPVHNQKNSEQLAEELVDRMGDRERERVLIEMYADSYACSPSDFQEGWVTLMGEDVIADGGTE